MVEWNGTSVWEGSDRELLPGIIDLHWKSRNNGRPRIVDCNYGRGLFWVGSRYERDVVGIDINPARGKTVVASNNHLPFANDSIDVLVYDPPHLIDNSKTPRKKLLSDAYSCAWGCSSLGDYMAPFIKEAGRAIKQNGILIAKVADIIHSATYQWQMLMLVGLIQESSLTACDCIVKTRPRPGAVSSKWKRQMHSRRRHCYLIVARKGRC